MKCVCVVAVCCVI